MLSSKLLKVLNTIFGLVPAIGCLLWLRVNSCLEKMGKAVIKAADSTGLDLIPMSFGCVEGAEKTVEVCGKVITLHRPAGLNLIPMWFGCVEQAGKTVEVCGKEITVHGPSGLDLIPMSFGYVEEAGKTAEDWVMCAFF